ncbi:MAG: ROK family protein [Acidobacteria bacterium]|nr:ROK family protein [Acidobacteriota bacterium]
MSLIGAIDIGGTKTAIGVVDENGTVNHECELSTDPTRGFIDSMQRIRRKLHEVADEAGSIDGIGICCPGPLDPFAGILGEVGTLPGWQGGSLVKGFEEEFRVRVAVENDADAAALAEHKWGSGKGTESFIYITISTGIGGGVILGGRLYRGSHGAHPELGHQIISDSGPLCYCGARGCWESLASGTAMSEWMRETESELGVLTAAEICGRARNGEERALRVTARESYFLGLGLSNIVTLFTPEVIALGGGVMKSSDLILGDALAVVNRLCTQVPVEGTRITLSSISSKVGLLGAHEAWASRFL